MVDDSSFLSLNDFNFGSWLKATSPQRAANQRTRRDNAQDSRPPDHQVPFADPKKSDAIGESVKGFTLPKNIDNIIDGANTVGLGNVTNTLRKKFFPTECSGRSLNVLDELDVDKLPLYSNPPVDTNIVQLGKKPSEGTVDYVVGVEVSTLNQKHMDEQFHAVHVTPGAVFHFVSAEPVETIVNPSETCVDTNSEVLQEVNIQVDQHNVGSQPTTLCHNTMSRNIPLAKKKWKRLARFEMQGHENVGRTKMSAKQIVNSCWSKVLGPPRVDIVFQRIQCVAQELTAWNRKRKQTNVC
ncbi:hypothetical protein ACOSP7_028978 [Xanthoceras sorbifolium]